jgi:hypothetical protein
VLGSLLVPALLACGGKGHGGGGAGAGAPGVGQRCQDNCQTGFICEQAGIFNGQCTVGCTSDPACGVLDSRARCFGTECGLPCSVDIDCPAGTHCGLIPGTATERACQSVL